MINKKRAHHLLTRIRRIPVLYLALGMLIGCSVSVFALRSNYQTMVGLRESVYEADKNNSDTAKALADLQAYVVRHMNTRLSNDASVYPPIQLKHTYERLVAAEQARVDGINATVYTEAQHYCEQQNATDFSGRNRVPCIQQYVQDHGAKARSIPPNLYQFDFTAAKWSPDLAGWSIITTFTLAALLLLRVGAEWWLKRYTK